MFYSQIMFVIRFSEKLACCVRLDWFEGRRLIGAVLHVSDEPTAIPDVAGQWTIMCDSTLNIGFAITVIIYLQLLIRTLDNRSDYVFTTEL